MNVVSLFSGIGGFDEGFRRAGFNVLAACEINADCRKVLARHFSATEIFEDVKTITRDTFAGRAIDVLVGGFPCQDLSVAGRRAGLAGERSGLWFEFVRIIGDHLPRWVVIENVPGLLSSNGGADFAVVLQGLVKLGYGVAWRILDAQYFGLAQRRERVFIVASLRDGRAAEVLFEREGGGWNPAPRRETGKRVAQTITGSLMRSGGATGGKNGLPVNLIEESGQCGGGDRRNSGESLGVRMRDVACDGDDARGVGEISRGVNAFGLIGHGEYADRPATLRAKGGDAAGGSEYLLAFGGNDQSGPREIATACTSHGRRLDFESETFIAHTLRGEGFDASEDGTGRGTPLIVAPDVAIPLTASGRGTERTGESRGQDTLIACRDVAASLTSNFGVRRLMPVECEALQGFLRDWTATGADGKPISDSARYRMLGNAVAVPVAEWIARRIARLEVE